MPIVKHINVVHDSNKNYYTNVFKYFDDEKKRPSDEISNLFNYAANKEKIKGDMKYIKTLNGVSIDSRIAKEQFEITRLKRLKEKNIDPNNVRKDSRCLYHFVVSFNKNDTEKFDWEELQNFSVQIAKEIAQDKYQAFLVSHLPSSEKSNEYFHTHIVINAYSKEYRGNKLQLENGYVQKLISKANKLAKEKGYSLVSEPKIYNPKDKSWYEMHQYKNNNSWKQQLKDDIKAAKKYSKDYEEFVSLLKSWGYGIRDRNFKNGKEYKTISFTPSKNNKEKKSIRGKSLGKEYSKESLKKYFSLSPEERKKIDQEAYSEIAKTALQKNDNIEDKIRISGGGKSVYINKKDKFKRKKTNFEIDIETEIELAKIRKESNTYLQNLFESLNVVNQLKINDINDLEKRLKEKNIYLSKYYKRKNEVNKLIKSKNEILKNYYYEDSSDNDKRTFDYRYYENASDIDKKTFSSQSDKERIFLEIEELKKEKKELDNKINDLKIYSYDLEKISNSFEYKNSKHQIRTSAKIELNKYRRRKELQDKVNERSK